MNPCTPPGAAGQGGPRAQHSSGDWTFPPFPLHKSCCPHNEHLASHFLWWLAPLGAEQGHFQHAAPMMPPSLTALLFLQGGFDRAGPGGEGCWGPWVGWGIGTKDRNLAGSQSHGCALLLQALQSPGSHLINPFPEMLLAFGGSCISMSLSSACPAIPQSALQLLKSALSRGVGRNLANKNNFPASARAESGSAVSRDPQRGLASARRVPLPGGLKISMRYRLPGGRVSPGWHL